MNVNITNGNKAKLEQLSAFASKINKGTYAAAALGVSAVTDRSVKWENTSH